MEPLVSPRRYAASIRSLVLAEDEMTLMEKNPPPDLDKDATFPWKSIEDPVTGVVSWLNIDTGVSSVEEPRRIWEHKLDDLERLRPIGHVARARDRMPRADSTALDSSLETNFRKEKRLDAIVAGWDWEEDDADARRRKHAAHAMRKRIHEEICRRQINPTHNEAVASVVVQLVSQVELRTSAESDRLARCHRRLVQTSWHPAVGRRHMRHLRGSLPRGENCVDLEYVDAFLTTCGNALSREPSSLESDCNHTDTPPKSPSRNPSSFRSLLNSSLRNHGVFHSFHVPATPNTSRMHWSPYRDERSANSERSVAFFTATLNLELSLLLPPTFTTIQTSQPPWTESINAFTGGSLHLETRKSNKGKILKRLDTRTRRRFESLLLRDVCRAAQVESSRVALDEFVTIRAEAVNSKVSTCVVGAPLPDPKLSETLAMRMRRALAVRAASHAGKLIEGQLLKTRKALGWRADRSNLIVAKISIVGTSFANAYKSASTVAAAAQNPSSHLRRLGSICCCCVDGAAADTLELRRRTWAQYWVFFVTPVFFGYGTQESIVNREWSGKGVPVNADTEALEVESSESERSNFDVVPRTLDSKLMLRELNACKARVAYDAVMKRPLVLGYDNIEHMTAIFSVLICSSLVIISSLITLLNRFHNLKRREERTALNVSSKYNSAPRKSNS